MGRDFFSIEVWLLISERSKNSTSAEFKCTMRQEFAGVHALVSAGEVHGKGARCTWAPKWWCFRRHAIWSIGRAEERTGLSLKEAQMGIACWGVGSWGPLKGVLSWSTKRRRACRVGQGHTEWVR